jgi:hypothetical protein
VTTGWRIAQTQFDQRWGLFDGTLGFVGEESAGAAFVRSNGATCPQQVPARSPHVHATTTATANDRLRHHRQHVEPRGRDRVLGQQEPAHLFPLGFFGGSPTVPIARTTHPAARCWVAIFAAGATNRYQSRAYTSDTANREHEETLDDAVS